MRVPESAMSGSEGGEEGERCTRVESLPRWTSAPPPPPTDYEPHAARHQSSPFAYDPALNERFALWHGDISTLEADIITNTTNEAMDERNPVSDRIFFRAGSSLKEEIFNEGKECRTGEVCVTGAHGLAARHLVHVVGPRYSPKYRAPAEHTLHSCYRNVLYKSQELGARTLALCIIQSVKRNFPPDVGAHIALRTIRRYLERSTRPCVVALVAADGAEAALLEALAPLYFPRSHNEARAARWRLPKDVGGPAGEPHQPPERRIRIIHNPQHAAPHPHTHATADDDGVELDASDTECSAEAEAAAAFARMHAVAPDTQRLLGTEPRYPPVADLMRRQIEQHERYERLLRRARSEDLSEVSGIGCLYRSGEDLLGRPVVVFVGKWFPVSDINLDKALLYLIQLLDPIVRGDYVIAYFHTLTSAANHPPFSWLKEVYTLLPYKYKKNLKAFYIVHPTFWTKMMTWWFTTFMAPAIKQKVHNLPGIEYLYAVMSRDQLDIPAFITEYDMTINGLHYFQADSSSS